MVDAEPERLGIELVNRYHAVKRAQLLRPRAAGAGLSRPASAWRR